LLVFLHPSILYHQPAKVTHWVTCTIAYETLNLPSLSIAFPAAYTVFALRFASDALMAG
jgi:hypothetical protein